MFERIIRGEARQDKPVSKLSTDRLAALGTPVIPSKYHIWSRNDGEDQM